MPNRTSLIAILSAGLIAVAGAALAQTPSTPQSSDDCLKAAFEIAEKAEQKKLSNEQIDRVEEMLTKMETHCDAKQFKDAMVVHKDIATYIEKL